MTGPDNEALSGSATPKNPHGLATGRDCLRVSINSTSSGSPQLLDRASGNFEAGVTRLGVREGPPENGGKRLRSGEIMNLERDAIGLTGLCRTYCGQGCEQKTDDHCCVSHASLHLDRDVNPGLLPWLCQQVDRRTDMRKRRAFLRAFYGSLREGLNYSSPFSSFLPPRFLSAAPRMSPSEAPESDDPYCATASFSSAISRALIDTETFRLDLST